jgi:hypothetical protein
MELNYLNIIRRQIFASLRCVTLFVPKIRKRPLMSKGLMGSYPSGIYLLLPQGEWLGIRVVNHRRTQLNDALIESCRKFRLVHKEMRGLPGPLLNDLPLDCRKELLAKCNSLNILDTPNRS